MALLCGALAVRDKSLLLVNCAQQRQQQQQRPKLVTFLGKGGVGKTFCALMAAQYYASIGLRTCLAVQSQDCTAEFLLDRKLRHYSSSMANDEEHFSAFRVQATKTLMEPLNQIKKADAQLNFSQGALQEVAAEELSVLPGMDSVMALGLLEQFTGFARTSSKRLAKSFRPKYDVVVYDGSNSEEVLRMFGSGERTRWYTKRFRSIVEKTDIGRVAMPSLLRLLEASIVEDSLSSESSSSDLWDQADVLLKGVAECFADPKTFSCYIVTDPTNKMAEKTALRHWGCAMQAGMHVAGFLHHAAPNGVESWKEKYAPLPVFSVPNIKFDAAPDWQKLLSELDENSRQGLQGDDESSSIKPVTLDPAARTVKCFLPGFDKSEVKLSQLKSSELLLEAGDQRRVISLPPQMHGKVAGAKLQDGSLVITLRS